MQRAESSGLKDNDTLIYKGSGGLVGIDLEAPDENGTAQINLYDAKNKNKATNNNLIARVYQDVGLGGFNYSWNIPIYFNRGLYAKQVCIKTSYIMFFYPG